MKRLPLILGFLFCGCGAFAALKPYNYDAHLVAVERPSDTSNRYSAPITTEQAEDGAARYVYADSLIEIGWVFTDEQIGFVLRNLTDHSMRVVWDDAAFVGIDGETSRVMHEGVRYSERDASMPASVVPRGGTLTDMVVPTSRVYYVSGQYGGWRVLGMIDPATAGAGDLTVAQQNVGKRFSVLFPIEVEGVVNEYTFTFEVTGVQAGEGMEGI